MRDEHTTLFGTHVAVTVFLAWLTVEFYMLQITFDGVELRYQRRPEYADCGAYQVSMGSLHW